MALSLIIISFNKFGYFNTHLLAIPFTIISFHKLSIFLSYDRKINELDLTKYCENLSRGIDMNLFSQV